MAARHARSAPEATSTSSRIFGRMQASKRSCSRTWCCAGSRAMASAIGARGPLSNRLAKRLVDAAQDVALDAVLSMSTVAQQQIFDSADLHEGVAAFFAKREPRFTGR